MSAGPGRRAGGSRALTTLAWLLAAANVACALALVRLEFARGAALPGMPAATWNDVVATLPNLVFPVVGAVIIGRQPRNPIGWILVATGVLTVVTNLLGEYAFYGMIAGHHGLPAAWIGAWASYWLWVPGNFTAPFALMLFPDGHFLTARWRRFGMAVLVLMAVVVVGSMFIGDPTGQFPVANPFGIPALGPILPVYRLALNICVPAFVVAAFVSFGLRYRRSSSEVRQQMKWVMYAFVLVPIAFLVGAVAPGGFGTTPNDLSAARDMLQFVAQTAVALAIGIAMLKYHLYDIDVVISRTLVYGALALFITLVYVAIVVGLGSLVGSGGRPNLLLSIVATAVVAVAFQPVRERLAKVANRLVYGKRATPYEVLADFSGHVAESYAADEVLPRMARVLADGTGAETALVWLRSANALVPAASWPAPKNGDPGAPGAAAPAVAVAGQLLPSIPGSDRAVAVRHQGELLGALTVAKRRGETLTPIEEHLLDDLAHQAGLVLKNVGLTADLRARLEELRESRQRLVKAQDEERRKLERNLHDGAQQHLVALKVKLGLAQTLAGKDPEKALTTIQQLKNDADEALETLRDLARGIYPPLLAEKGLAAALESQARKAALRVEVTADGVGRYPQDVEAAVYFCVLEALQNVQKYAGAERAGVHLEAAPATIRFEVEDDGRGFDLSTARHGSGLDNMRDRVDALGGTLEVRSSPGGGTLVAGTLPVLGQDGTGVALAPAGASALPEATPDSPGG